ncbi:MAG: nucleotidyltransferase domain-containing protein [Acidobacteria bacterium]|nr:nucleotidyltransferase domain-containing protein [Acidobacteriota bacterium]
MAEVWRITPEKFGTAVDRIVQLCSPSRVIVFGSFASGGLHGDNDLDLLVAMNGRVDNPRKESVRLRRALKGLLIPVDIIVMEEDQLAGVADIPGLVHREAPRNGQVVHVGVSWRHTAIMLNPVNHEFESILLTSEEGQFQVLAELLEVLAGR